MKRHTRLFAILLAICCLVACNTSHQPTDQAETRTSPYGVGLQPDNYGIWPTADFITATPESQGMDSNVILERLETVIGKNVQPDSYLILRNGYLVSETYFHGYDKDTAHTMYSVTKSVVSALVGIAISENYITGPEQKVSDFFPDAEIPEEMQYKKNMTIQHLLTMTSGLNGDDEWDTWESAENIGDALFALPQEKEPGVKFKYDTAATHLLGILVSRATGKTLYEYAQEKLFGPLGMTSVVWDEDPEGNNYGGHGISMTPRDMLRFGYLYLNYGRWEDQQIIPADWVAQSPPQAQQSGAYGHLFWANEDNPELGYEAAGAYGQYIGIFPDLDMVVVVTNSGNNNQKHLFQDINKGVQDTLLAENPQAQEELAQLAAQASPAFPSYAELMAKLSVKAEHIIALDSLQEYSGNGTISVNTTEDGLRMTSDGWDCGLETKEKYRFPLMVDVTYLPGEEKPNLWLGFRKGGAGISHNQEEPYVAQTDFIRGFYSAYVHRETPETGRQVRLQWIITEEFQALVANETVLCYSTDNVYMRKLYFPLRKWKSSVRFGTEFSAVTLQSITISELQ